MNDYLFMLRNEIIKRDGFVFDKDGVIMFEHDYYYIYCSPCLSGDNNISITIIDENYLDGFCNIELDYNLTYSLDVDLENYFITIANFINTINFILKHGVKL
jgi:hypothetical protein